ncbi:MAG TPA: hypothetical protein QGI72_03825 [Poseidonia sp.]|nr:hypothetical protein [Poseidonia sp.]
MDESLLAEVINIQNDVRSEFGWTYQDDVDSAQAMFQVFQSNEPFGVPHWSNEGRNEALLNTKERLSRAETIVLVGAAAKKADLESEWPDGTQFIAADGAVGAFPNHLKPACIITDLDGGMHLEQAASNGFTMVVHAHGDNQNVWEQYFPLWAKNGQPPLILTHQTHEHFDHVHNPGGFTDGDRAACFLHWLNIDLSRVKLVGFSTESVGIWSGTTNPELKIKKLGWMEKILKRLHPIFDEHIF